MKRTILKTDNYPDCPYTGKVFASPDSVPMDYWLWGNFTPDELKSKGDGKVMIDTKSMDALQALRDNWGQPLHLTSAFRSAAHNRRVGGVRNSMHVLARAYDINVSGWTQTERRAFERMAIACGFTGFGFYKNQQFIHIDTGRRREWGQRW